MNTLGILIAAVVASVMKVIKLNGLKGVFNSGRLYRYMYKSPQAGFGHFYICATGQFEANQGARTVYSKMAKQGLIPKYQFYPVLPMLKK